MKKEEFYFDSRDGKTKLFAVRWLPEGEVRGVIQIVHGMAEHICRYEHVADFFTKKGFVVTGDDHLGHGKSVSGDGTYGYICKQDAATVIVRDVHRLKKLTEEAYPGKPYFIWGHSMGSFIVRNYIMRYGSGISGAIIEGTGQQPTAAVSFGIALSNGIGLLRGEKYVSKTLNKLALGDDSKIPEGHKNDWICTDKNVVSAYEKDPLCGFTFTANGFKTLFTLIKRQNSKKGIENIPKDLPIYFISGSKDMVGACGEGVKKAYKSYKKAGIKDVSLKLYDNVRHEIHNEPIKDEVFNDVLGFVNGHIR